MGALLVFVSMMLASLISYQLALLPKSDSSERTVGGYDSSTQTLQNSYETLDRGRPIVQEPRIAARNANIAAIRICRAISREMKEQYLAGDATCSNYWDSTTLLGFIGTAGTTGSLDTLYTQGTSSALSCASTAAVASYGRYLFSRSLPKNLISGKNVNFNLVGVVSTHPDPCGYNEIIY